MSQFVSIFRLLNDSNVRYVVVGGVATLLHGYVRMTADLDLIVDLDAAEAEKAIRALTDYGFKPRIPVDPLSFADIKERTRWVDEKGMQVFSLYHPTSMVLTVDLFARHPIPFEQLWQRSVLMDLGDTKVRVCSIDDLIEMKRQAGRHKDLADIEQLIKIKALTKEQSNDKND
jgi:predicted nucleotidyltransferase